MKTSRRHPRIPLFKYLLPIKASLFVIYIILIGGGGIKSNGKKIDLAYSNINPQTIQLDLPTQKEPEFDVRKNGIGGLITVDVNNDEQKDFIITKLGRIEVYEHSGKKLWSKEIDIQLSAKSESQGLPGLHGPGVQAADVDGDRKAEVLFLTKDNTVHIVEGVNGETQ
ncbi:MAG: VCBS repeat-containing protein [Pleurocapsa sp. MO_226.B13]|nr:VCBS repeat-containing protein [Pleurocapsa sp. MO_226.B13]